MHLFSSNQFRVQFFGKKLLSRNFHIVTLFDAQCAHFFRKNFVKATVLLNKSLKSWFDEIFFQWEQIIHFSTLCCAQCGKCGNSLSRFFGKNFVKVTVLLKKLLKSWFHENFFQWERISRFSTLCSVEKWKIYSHWNFFPSNQLFSDLFSKCVAFTKFLPKKRESNFTWFRHCAVLKLRNFLSRFFGKNSVKARHLLNKSLKSLFDGKKFQWE